MKLSKAQKRVLNHMSSGSLISMTGFRHTVYRCAMRTLQPATVDILLKSALIERVPGLGNFTCRYRITPAGRRALDKAEK